MDLQLNVKSSGGKKNKQQNKSGFQLKSQQNSDYSFVSKPVLEGKTIAKVRNKPQKEKSNDKNFSFLNKQNNTNQNERAEKFYNINSEIKAYSKIEKKTKIVEEKQTNSDEDDSSLSMNIKNVPVRKEKKNKDSNKHVENSFKDDIKKKSDSNKQEPRKRTIESHISSLFRNNPEIPRLGQRFVKPITEKVFSGKDFKDLDVHDYSVANLEKNMGLKQLTVVQQKACPVMLKGRDVLVRSQTGSGKTLCYALPIIEALQAIRPKLSRQDGIRALVVVPTRELALQTYELFIKLVRPFTWIVPGYLIGGEKRKAEKARIRKGFNILIGTPGRLCDHIQHTASMSLGKVRCLVLDEADRLLDMGYEKDVSSIVETLKKHQTADKYDPLAMIRETVSKGHIHFGEGEEGEKRGGDKEGDEREEEGKGVVEEYKHHMSRVMMSEHRQTILLSATLTKAVESLAGLTMEDPVFIDASEGRATLIADSLSSKPKQEAEKVVISQTDKTDEENMEDDFEVVPQDADSDGDSGSEDGESDENGTESDDEGSEDSDDASSDDSDDSESEEVDKSKLTLYKGLKAFSGFKSEKDDKVKKKKKKDKNEERNKEIKDSDEKTIKKGKEKTKPSKEVTKATDGGSDSDSDYDFFAVAKVDIKESTKDKEKKKKERKTSENDSKDVEIDTNFMTQSGDYENPFQNALQSAIVQDEMVIPSSVTQVYILAPMKLRLVTISALILQHCVKPGSGKILIFMATQDMIDYHCELLSKVLTGKKPHNILIEDNINSKRNKKHAKRMEKTEEIEEVKQESPVKFSEGDKDVVSDDDYEFKYDGMDLDEYEAKMKEKKAFVDVDFFQLHGSMNQKTRTEVFNTFRKANSGVLLCTTQPLKGSTMSRLTKQYKQYFIEKYKNYKRVKEKTEFINCAWLTGIKTKLQIKRQNKKLQKSSRNFGNYSTKPCDIRNIDSKCFRTRKTEKKLSRFKCNSTIFYNLNESMNACEKCRMLVEFSKSDSGVLFCTDVAARGLDLPHVDCIVQYTGPISITDYVHRVGRTARAGNVGTAIMILLPSEAEFIRQLEERRIRLHQEDMSVCHKALLTEDNSKRLVQRAGGPAPLQLAAAELQQSYEELIKSDKQLYTKACKAFTSWLRFYSTYPREARGCFDRRALHIGHAATALALTDTPKKIGKEAPKPVNRKDSDLKRRAEKEKNVIKVKPMSAKAANREKRMVVSEYESGLEPPKKKSKHL